MAKLVWDKAGEKRYETGLDHGVLYVAKDEGGYDTGVVWNGLTAVTESPSGAEESAIYADNIKYLSLRSTEEFGATIEAYSSPEEFDVCDGQATIKEGVTIGQQKRKRFCFSYRTKKGTDENDDAGYIIHIIYNATASPTEKAYNTINDSPEAITMSWEVSTVPVEVTGFKPTAHIEIDSTKVKPTALTKIEAALYGDDTSGTPKVLLPDEIVAIITTAE